MNIALQCKHNNIGTCYYGWVRSLRTILYYVLSYVLGHITRVFKLLICHITPGHKFNVYIFPSVFRDSTTAC